MPESVRIRRFSLISTRLRFVCASLVTLLFLTVECRSAAGGPGTFALSPGNPRCFLYQGKPVVLITATEHYGAVLNGEFDYIPYLDTLKRNGLNLSRLFTFYRELENSIPPLGYANTLAPRPGKEVMPWKRTGPGNALDGGLKFDLNQWNPDYFRRLKDFLNEAAARKIIVEVVLFCNPYQQAQWSWFPCDKDNNINGVGGGITDVKQFMEQHDPTVLRFQKNFVRKIVEELNPLDNIYFEISNETSTRRKERELAGRQAAWHFALCEVVRDVEAKLPKKHLIAVNAHQKILAYEQDGKEYTETGDASYFDSPLVDIINYHYISRKTPGRGVAALDSGSAKVGNIWGFFQARSHVKKPIVFDENFAGVVRGAPVVWDRNRMEAWEMILSGGAGFDHLDWSFTPQDPLGAGKVPISDGRRLDGRDLRQQLGALAALWRDCGPDKMAPNRNLVAAYPDHTLAFASSRGDGKTHVVYAADARPDNAGFGQPIRGNVTLRLPPGTYEPKVLHSGAHQWIKQGATVAKGPETEVHLPEFRQDCALILAAK